MKRFSTKIRDEAVRRKRREREARRKQYLTQVFSSLTKLSRDVAFKKAYVFGSLVRPKKFTKRPDIDIGFVGLKDEDFF